MTGFGYGLLLVATALGAAAPGVFGHRMIAALGTRWSIVVPYLAFGVTQVLIGAVPVTAVVAVVGFVLGGAITLWNVVTLSIRQRVIEPAAVRARQQRVPLDRYRRRRLRRTGRRSTRLRDGQPARAVPRRRRHHARRACRCSPRRVLRAADDIDLTQALDLTPAPPSMT